MRQFRTILDRARCNVQRDHPFRAGQLVSCIFNSDRPRSLQNLPVVNGLFGNDTFNPNVKRVIPMLRGQDNPFEFFQRSRDF